MFVENSAHLEGIQRVRASRGRHLVSRDCEGIEGGETPEACRSIGNVVDFKKEAGTDKTAQRFPEISRVFFPLYTCEQREKT